LATVAVPEYVTDRAGRRVVVEGVIPLGNNDPLKLATLPTAIGMWAWIGPGLLWSALAQGSGELIWWPYLTAKYGTAFLGVMVWASMLQWWYNLEILRYEIMTGENAMTGFIRLGKWFALLVGAMIVFELMWFGGFTASSGNALATLTNFPAGWDVPGQTRFWTYVLIVIYVLVLVFGPVAYNWVERISMAVVVITVAGVLFACLQPQVYTTFGSFAGSLFNPFGSWPFTGMPGNWDAADASILVTSIAYAGAGGWGQVFYTYWFRDKGAGFGQYAGRVTSPITGELETIPATGFAFSDNEQNHKNFNGWMNLAASQNSIGIFFNTLTTGIMMWLAWAVLIPAGKQVSSTWQLAVVQADFFAIAWGDVGRSVFLFVAAMFLADAWLQNIDGYSRMLSEMIYGVFPKQSRKWPLRNWYYLFLGWCTITSLITVAITVPGMAILIRGTASFFAMPIMGWAFIYLNFYLAPRAFPKWVKPNKFNYVLMWICTCAYSLLFIWYIVASILPQFGIKLM